ncbi:MAG: diadenylate cyclase CdaA [Selenomonas sp.]|uniref:diadenylate cyclase CdaA n=1 Tax=Selenomonas sp. TaxID=2053611 RepID=UPI002600CEFF|nr:diadenylate cyclase CdaA [Selenomonas sp.]MCI6085423.1 diadenylate cyclase CdaA [Selenomonas sp.]
MPMDFSLPQVPTQLRGILSTIGPLDILDILIVAIILYKVYEMLQDTRAITLVKGLLVLLGITLVCNWMELHVISWLLQKAVTLIFVALPIVFQPELRRALEHLGQGRFLANPTVLDDRQAQNVVHELVRAVRTLASTKTGALLDIERNMGLNDICASGIQTDALITAEFLLNVFIPNTPLHDGAGIVRGNRLIAASCYLPLTERSFSTELGTRHRAAIGLSEQCDALVVVVSEETGTISVAEEGHITRHLDAEALKNILMPVFSPEKQTFRELVENWRKKK